MIKQKKRPVNIRNKQKDVLLTIVTNKGRPVNIRDKQKDVLLAYSLMLSTSKVALIAHFCQII